jgi:hypothetical protein
MNNNTYINDNRSGGLDGGGVCFVSNNSSSELNMNDHAHINENSGAGGAGVRFEGQGIFTMNTDASIYENTGIGVYASGTFTMNENTSVHRNGSRGVNLQSGTFTMNVDASVHHNSGTGVYGSSSSGTITMNNNAKIYANTGRGAIFSGTMLMLTDSEIYGNADGGIYVRPGSSNSLIMEGNSSIHDNTARGDGGGVSLGNETTFLMKGNSKVIDNESTNGFGGGVYATCSLGDPPLIPTDDSSVIYDDSVATVITMQGLLSTISGNTAGAGKGSAVYLNSALNVTASGGEYISDENIKTFYCKNSGDCKSELKFESGNVTGEINGKVAITVSSEGDPTYNIADNTGFCRSIVTDGSIPIPNVLAGIESNLPDGSGTF